LISGALTSCCRLFGGCSRLSRPVSAVGETLRVGVGRFEREDHTRSIAYGLPIALSHRGERFVEQVLDL